MDEQNRLRKGGPGHSQYQLWRFTPWVQLNAGEMFGGYVQAIDASMFGLDVPYTPAPIDQNRTDLLQLYGELRLPATEDVQAKYRYGRQFLQYGNQRLLSPLGWANTYRNFEGHKLMLTSAEWDLDLFSMHSLNAAAGNVPRPNSFDRADQSRTVSGAYATWKGLESAKVDLYWLFSDESDSSPDLMDGRRQTVGSRYVMQQKSELESQLAGTWNLDAEGAWQFGRDDFGSAVRDRVQAGMATGTGGYTFDELPWSPALGGIFYWGSGGRSSNGTIHTFHSLYPLGHAWWGQIDNFSGQNLLDYGMQVSLAPTKKYRSLHNGTGSMWPVARTASTQSQVPDCPAAAIGILAMSWTLSPVTTSAKHCSCRPDGSAFSTVTPSVTGQWPGLTPNSSTCRPPGRSDGKPTY